MNNITIFYDSYCPLCVSEMMQLKDLDTKGKIDLVDINQEDFEKNHPLIDREKANNVLHGQVESGELLTGLDVTYYAWKCVGRKPWLAVLRWPVIRFFADLCYLFFAKYRYTFSFILTGQRRCSICETNNPSVNECRKNN